MLTACAGRVQDGPPAVAGPDKLMFIRHGEEPGSPDGPLGVTQAGETDPRSLSVRGWTRAGALVTLFDPRDAEGKPVPTRPELARPTTIVASDPSHGHSKRSLETVTPLAAALDLTVDTRFASSQTAQAADAILATTGSVLVAWTHDEIDHIISHLTGVTPTPPHWPGGRYDLIYVLTRTASGWRFAQVPQMLLAGDQQPPVG